MAARNLRETKKRNYRNVFILWLTIMHIYETMKTVTIMTCCLSHVDWMKIAEWIRMHLFFCSFLSFCVYVSCSFINKSSQKHQVTTAKWKRRRTHVCEKERVRWPVIRWRTRVLAWRCFCWWCKRRKKRHTLTTEQEKKRGKNVET